MPRQKATQVALALDEEADQQDDRVNYFAGDWPVDEGWVMAFSLRLTNTGETTVRAAKLNLTIDRPRDWDVAWNKVWIAASDKKPSEFLLPRGKRIYPAETVQFPDGVFLLRTKSIDDPIELIRLRWQVFLDNSQPCSGTIDLTSLAKGHVDRWLTEIEAEDGEEQES